MTEPPDEFHTELINTVHKEASHHRAGKEQDGDSASTSNMAAEKDADLHDGVGPESPAASLDITVSLLNQSVQPLCAIVLNSSSTFNQIYVSNFILFSTNTG